MTLKLLLDWAQIIYSMKNIKIYPKDWLQLHPYKQSDPTDSYYTNIANRIYGMLEETRLAYSFEKDEVKQISIRMAAYFEDVISGLNIWRSFITEHKALYGKFLLVLEIKECFAFCRCREFLKVLGQHFLALFGYRFFECL